MTTADTFGKILRLRLRMTERRGKDPRRGCHPERNEVEPKDLPHGFGTIHKYEGKILRLRLRMTGKRGKDPRRGCHPERNKVEPKDLPSGFWDYSQVRWKDSSPAAQNDRKTGQSLTL